MDTDSQPGCGICVHPCLSLANAAGHFCSRINVGAIPDNVEKPDGPVAVNQVEQPCTLPRYECGCTSTRIFCISRWPYCRTGNVSTTGSRASCTTYGLRSAERTAFSHDASSISDPRK